ncbi:N-fatty-acyl-amino acid synthase/hydrolase PM20D1-like [Neocloeon triangulifer]|uniref:N-fatty-acyl-amino acid synthase/hydrolase PM20D1-like n=1 Tax=Neocloeon triangulifer TaxID=2078957 RepID=UPI00286ED076|nr:N-fatty-acyl-amino acid synthase/hydrolase PM20D1-like [Neocloeon triangulifer]
MAQSKNPKWQFRWRCGRWWWKVFKLMLKIPLAISLLLAVVVIFRAINASTPASTLEILNNAVTDGVEDGKKMERAHRLAGALRLSTISYEPGKQEVEELLKLHKYLEKEFPAVHNCSFVKKEVINLYSLLYTVTGTNPNKMPYMLASHLDVVPADPENWQVDPFSGQIINDTYIYGRGTIDDKGGVLGILEALEFLIKKGERPQRSFFVAFGHDEEVSGKQGAQEIARTLLKRGVNRLDFVLDEGYTVTRHILPGTSKHVALVGVSEKGHLTLELSVNGNPGHSSFPPWESAIGILSDAITKLEKNKLPSLFGTGPERSTFEYLAPHVGFLHRILYSNMWLFAGIMSRVMEREALSNAMVRTTSAITVFHGGIKDNVVPAHARAIINHRVHPSQTISQVIEFDKRTIDDPRVEIKVKTSKEAHPVSPYSPDDVQYNVIARSIYQTFDDVVVIPGVLIANTDTRWYLGLSSHLYRFFPTVIYPEDTNRYHGIDERISIDDYQRAVSFYYRVMKNADLIIGHVPSTTANQQREL